MTAKIVLTSKHVAILRSFDDLHGHFSQPRKNCRVHVWDKNVQGVVFDLDHISNPLSPYRDLGHEKEWRDLRVWGLIAESHLGHPVYELTEEASIYLA